jgi:hypothetical protein
MRTENLQKRHSFRRQARLKKYSVWLKRRNWKLTPAVRAFYSSAEILLLNDSFNSF